MNQMCKEGVISNGSVESVDCSHPSGLSMADIRVKPDKKHCPACAVDRIGEVGAREVER